MSFSDTTATLAPWLSIIPVAAIVGGLVRYLGADRVRSRLSRDIEILGNLPEGPAKTAVQEAVDVQAQRLRDRVVDGYSVSSFAAQVLYLLTLATLFLIPYLALKFDNKVPFLRPHHDWSKQMDPVFEFITSWGLKLSLLALVARVLFALGAWLIKNITGKNITLRTMLEDFKQFRDLERARRDATSRGSDQAGSPAPHPETDDESQPPA